MVLDPKTVPKKEALKDILTSKDWISGYSNNHVDIDYNKGVFSSSSSSSGSEPELANEQPKNNTSSDLPLPKSIDILQEFLRPSFDMMKFAPGKSGDKSVSSLRGVSVPDLPKSGEFLPTFEVTRSATVPNLPRSGDHVVALPTKSLKSGTDFLSEYNNMFSVSTEELTHQAGMGVAKPDGVGSTDLSFKPSVDLGFKRSMDLGLGSGSMDLNAEEKTNSIPGSIDLLKKILKSSVDAPKEVPDKPMPPAAPEEPVVAPPKKKKKKSRRNKDPDVKQYVCPSDLDVLLGRGGRSNHHRGNKRYRDEVHNLQQWYKASTKNEKTDLSQLLVDRVHSYGGQFLKNEKDTDKWYIVTNIVARRKASQALREHLTPEQRAAKKAKKVVEQTG
mmetsp:Transcript_26335/g.61259  ORF Transcript_26335/g.61259 Transcript_26335/m.61259 type:complete len:388 (+) Transcript_26335:51-1214(+)